MPVVQPSIVQARLCELAEVLIALDAGGQDPVLEVARSEFESVVEPGDVVGPGLWCARGDDARSLVDESVTFCGSGDVGRRGNEIFGDRRAQGDPSVDGLLQQLWFLSKESGGVGVGG